ncbi:AraC family transcriptional regulator [Enhygromyxa salina]|nr:AraC family transcriptional regulator [Enhygromyxa salina]
MREPTVATRLVAPLLETCAKLSGGAVARDLRRRFGIDEAALADPEARMPLPRFYDLLEDAAARTGDDLLGMHYSLGFDAASLDVLGFLAMTSVNLGVAFERMFRYQALLYEGEFGTIERAAGRVTVRILNWGPARPAHRMWSEAAAVDMVVNGRRMVGQEFEVHELRFRHAAPTPVAARRLRELLAAPVRFEAEDDALVVPEAVLALPMPSADPAMFEYFDREAARRAAEFARPSSNLLDELRRVIRAVLPEGVPELSALAEELEHSPRTLQRRLAEHGTSLRQVVDELRHELALHHLAAGLSIAEVSFLLGFSEPSAFHRAFKRWTDRTPAQWRKRSASP